MLKRSINYKGYLFIESLFSLTILTIVIGSYLSINTFMIERTNVYTKQLTMERILYEEVKDYEYYSGLSIRKIFKEGEEYVVTISEQDHQIVKVAIKNGKDQLTIEVR